MKTFMLVCTMLITSSAIAAECPWEKPYKCRTVAYMEYQCGCGIEWKKTTQTTKSPYIATPSVNVTVNVPSNYAPRGITYGDKSTFYSFVAK